VRISAELWDQFGDAVRRAYPDSDPRVDRSAVVRQFIRWYVRHADARLPERPPE
jgi:hypothetical protein